MAASPFDRIALNPFHVLELAPSASRADVERAGQRLLALLGVGSATAQSYATPLGIRRRDADLVRQAVASLRQPRERVVWELWAGSGQPSAPGPQPTAASPAPRVWGWPRAWPP